MKRFREWLIPELQREPDEARQKEVWRRASSGGMTGWLMAGSTVGGLIPFLLLSSGLLTRSLGRPLQFTIVLAVVSLAAVALTTIGFTLMKSKIRRKARKYLQQNGMAICVPCGYDITGNTNGICPECGAAGSVEYEAWKAE